MSEKEYKPNTVDELIKVLQDLSRNGMGNYHMQAEYSTFRVTVDTELKGVYID